MHYERFESLHQPNEAVTEQELIRPVLELLGWADYLPQQGAAGREDVPDHLLFADAASKARATARTDSGDRFQDALIVQESKRFGLALDQRDRTDGLRGGTPHGQMLRYLTTADVASEGRIRFGILTNGSVWRLCDRRAQRLLPGGGQPLQEGGRVVFAALPGPHDLALRSPRQLGTHEPTEHAQSVPQRSSQQRATRRCALPSADAVLGSRARCGAMDTAHPRMVAGLSRQRQAD